MGIIHLKLKNYNESEKYFNLAIQLSKEIGYKLNLREIYNRLAQLNAEKGNYKNAYEFHKLFLVYKDSIDNESTREETIKNQLNYTFEKKEAIAAAEHKQEIQNEKQLSEEKSRKQKIIIFSVVIGLLLVVVFTAFVFRSLYNSNKQKKIIETQKLIVKKKIKR